MLPSDVEMLSKSAIKVLLKTLKSMSYKNIYERNCLLVSYIIYSNCNELIAS